MKSKASILCNIYVYTVAIIVVIIPSGCKKFLEIEPPTSVLVTESVFNNDASAISALVVIYSQMVTNLESFNMAKNTGFLGDEIKNYSAASLVSLYRNDMVNTTTGGPWNNAYNYIYQSNAIIEGLINNEGLSDSAKRQLTGECLFIRAFWHFYLTNLYGDVPLVTSTDYTVNSTLSRTPRIQVLNQIIKDLSKAKDLINENYVDGTNAPSATNRVRPNKSASVALLARAYLYLGNYIQDNSSYVNAEAEATLVINNTLYNLPADLNSVFLVNSPEAIWQLQIPEPATRNTADGNAFILSGAPSTGSSNNTALSTQLMNSFETGDTRRSNWTGSITTSNATYYFPYKYKIKTGANVTEYNMVLRLAEQYLIRAEARAEIGNVNSAIDDLNVIRKRAGLPDYAGPIDKSSVLSAILHERQVELFTEWGNRWFDINRTGNTNAIMSIVTPLKGGTWNSDGHQMLFPIPQSEIDKDPNLTQNLGY